MSYEIEWRPSAIEDITALFEYLAENASLWDARNVTERLITATDRPEQQIAGIVSRYFSILSECSETDVWHRSMGELV